MRLRDYFGNVEGKLVGRVGVEPTTKRLRAAFPNPDIPAETDESPLIQRLDSAPKDSAFEGPLRGISRPAFWLVWLMGALLAWAIIWITIWSLSGNPPQPPPNACPPSDAANPWCLK